MKWKKKGHIYSYNGEFDWAEHSFSKCTPFIRKNGVIRVYGGMRDKLGVSRIGFVDLDPSNLNKIINIGNKPVVDIGQPGTFDDNGVVPTCVFNFKGKTFLYYEGYQLANKVKFLSYTGLAISEDDGETFVKYSTTPVTERIPEELLIRAIHCVIPTENNLKVWYTAGSSFEKIGDTFHPNYTIKYVESKTGTSYSIAGKTIIETTANEYRVGKPFVFIKDGVHYMLFSKASHSTSYRIESAVSKDGVHWERLYDNPIPPSNEGWDSKMICYPYVLQINNQWVLFYNGNEFGRTGFGFAILENEDC